MPVALMLATLTERRGFGDDFLLERKFDGERCVARKDGGEISLESRTGNDLTRTYPEVGAAVAAQRPRGLLLDGEVVAYDGDQTSFGRLQRRLGVRSALRGADGQPSGRLLRLRPARDRRCGSHRRPLLERRARLVKAIRPRAALQVSEAWRGDSERRFSAACRSGWEGLIAKRADAPYTRGRSKDWLKLKCTRGQEFVIGGYTDPAGSRTDFGALLVGYHDNGRLVYAGKVGTGYSKARCAPSAPGSARLRRPHRRSSRCGPPRAAPIGPAPSSSPRSVSPNGQATVGCASHGSSGCGTTSCRTTSSARSPSEPDIPITEASRRRHDRRALR